MRAMSSPSNNDPEEWNLVAEAYDRVNVPFMRLFCEEALRLAAPKADAEVLDVATGPGTLALLAAPRVAKVVATDFADEMLARLRARIDREKVANVEALKMNGQALELGSDRFDAAFSIFGLIFFADRSRGFQELLRVLKPGGVAVVAGWVPLERMPAMHALVEGMREAVPDLPRPSGTPPVLSLADPETFHREMTLAGFDDVNVHLVQRSLTIEGSISDFWDQIVPAHAGLASVRQKVSPDQWQRVAEACKRRLEALFGSGPVEFSGEANLGVGYKSE